MGNTASEFSVRQVLAQVLPGWYGTISAESMERAAGSILTLFSGITLKISQEREEIASRMSGLRTWTDETFGVSKAPAQASPAVLLAAQQHDALIQQRQQLTEPSEPGQDSKQTPASLSTPYVPSFYQLRCGQVSLEIEKGRFEWLKARYDENGHLPSRFLSRILNLLLRYSTWQRMDIAKATVVVDEAKNDDKNGNGSGDAVTQKFMEHKTRTMPRGAFAVLEECFGVRHECFASPLNATLSSYCSLFADTDEYFG